MDAGMTFWVHSNLMTSPWHTVYGHKLLYGLGIVEYIAMELLVMIKLMACVLLTVGETAWHEFGIFKVTFMCLEYFEIWD